LDKEFIRQKSDCYVSSFRKKRKPKNGWDTRARVFSRATHSSYVPAIQQKIDRNLSDFLVDISHGRFGSWSSAQAETTDEYGQSISFSRSSRHSSNYYASKVRVMVSCWPKGRRSLRAGLIPPRSLGP
jgi:hypothetical protein